MHCGRLSLSSCRANNCNDSIVVGLYQSWHAGTGIVYLVLVQNIAKLVNKAL